MFNLVFCWVLYSTQKEYSPFSHFIIATPEWNDGERQLSCLVGKTNLAMLGVGVGWRSNPHTLCILQCVNAAW